MFPVSLQVLEFALPERRSIRVLVMSDRGIQQETRPRTMSPPLSARQTPSSQRGGAQWDLPLPVWQLEGLGHVWTEGGLTWMFIEASKHGRSAGAPRPRLPVGSWSSWFCEVSRPPEGCDG